MQKPPAVDISILLQEVFLFYVRFYGFGSSVSAFIFSSVSYCNRQGASGLFCVPAGKCEKSKNTRLSPLVVSALFGSSPKAQSAHCI